MDFVTIAILVAVFGQICLGFWEKGLRSKFAVWDQYLVEMNQNIDNDHFWTITRSLELWEKSRGL